MGIRTPAYRQPSTAGQISCSVWKPDLRLLSADFTELYNIGGNPLHGLPAIRSIRRALQGVTLSFHPSEYQFSKVLGYMPFDFVRKLFTYERVARLSPP